MKFQSKCEMIGNFGCLLLCYAYIVGKSEEWVFEYYERMVARKLIDKDCTVLDAEKLLYFMTGENYRVTKTDKIPKGLYCCKYEYTDKKSGYHNHWVVRSGNSIVYDSLDDSQCVKIGKVAKDLPFREVIRM